MLIVDPTGNLGRSVSASREAFRVEHGERMLIWSEGGPSIGRGVVYPPPLEIEVADGLYVLVNDGPPEDWHYVFNKTDSRR